MGIKKKITSEKKYDPNPWAVCHTTVDKDKDPDKYERCVHEVKNKQKDSKPLKKRKGLINQQTKEPSWESIDPSILEAMEFGNDRRPGGQVSGTDWR